MRTGEFLIHTAQGEMWVKVIYLHACTHGCGRRLLGGGAAYATPSALAARPEQTAAAPPPVGMLITAPPADCSGLIGTPEPSRMPCRGEFTAAELRHS